MTGPGFLGVLKMAATSHERGNCVGVCVSFRRLKGPTSGCLS